MNNYHGNKKPGPFFEGWYLKHQQGEATLAVIPGVNFDEEGKRFAFIQVITDKESFYLDFPMSSFRTCRGRFALKLGKNIFGQRGIKLDIEEAGLSLHGRASYGVFAPIAYDIMGPFAMFSNIMECNHGILSMGHRVRGSFVLNGERLDFSRGLGYIEKDWGSSFPRRYLWTQCSFPEAKTSFTKERCSVMCSVAKIPFMGLDFWGCIAVAHFKGKEYRLSTYLGARVEALSGRGLRLRQGKLLLEVKLTDGKPQKLKAPSQGGMTRTIHENASCQACYRLSFDGKVLFERESERASFEWVGRDN